MRSRPRRLSRFRHPAGAPQRAGRARRRPRGAPCRDGPDRQERPRIVDEPGEVPEARILDRGAPATAHRVRRIEKPPGSPDLESRVVAGHRCQLSSEHRLVHGVDDKVEPFARSERREQGLELAGQGCRSREISADVAPESRSGAVIMIPIDSWMQLHNETVLAGHPGHLCEHECHEPLRVARL
jgi:hypothetical protein